MSAELAGPIRFGVAKMRSILENAEPVPELLE
jgi:hypothetical protein